MEPSMLLRCPKPEAPALSHKMATGPYIYICMLAFVFWHLDTQHRHKHNVLYTQHRHKHNGLDTNNKKTILSTELPVILGRPLTIYPRDPRARIGFNDNLPGQGTVTLIGFNDNLPGHDLPRRHGRGGPETLHCDFVVSPRDFLASQDMPKL